MKMMWQKVAGERNECRQVTFGPWLLECTSFGSVKGIETANQIARATAYSKILKSKCLQFLPNRLLRSVHTPRTVLRCGLAHGSMRSPAKSKPCVHQPSGNSAVPCAAVNSCATCAMNSSNGWRFKRIFANLIYMCCVLCDDCVVIYLCVCVCACEDYDWWKEQTLQEHDWIFVWGPLFGKPIEICSPGTLFVFLAEARSATNDAKPPWNSRSRFYHLSSSFLMFFTSLTWSFSLSPTFDLAQRHKLWHERHAELEFENRIPLQSMEVSRRSLESPYSYFSKGALFASFFWLCCSLANSASSLALARPSWNSGQG